MTKPHCLAALLTIGTAFAQMNPRIVVENGVTLASFSPVSGANHAFTGAPYAAKEIHDAVKPLPNGGHVAAKTILTSIWQDTQGRKRFDRQFLTPDDRLVTIAQILDPVDGAIYILDPEAKIAHRFKSTFRSMAVLTSAVPAARPTRTTQSPNGSTMTNESLGTQVIGGITAYGTRSTMHYPAGAAGNEQPFDFITENWNSPQIGTNLLFKIQDPRSGDSTIKLENVVLGEPDPTLLRPPAGYRVVDEAGTFQIKVK